MTVVEIPSGSGNFYRYEYDPASRATIYLGTVGQAPALSEQEFFSLLDESKEVYTNKFDFQPGRVYTYEELPDDLRWDADNHFDPEGFGWSGTAQDARYIAVIRRAEDFEWYRKRDRAWLEEYAGDLARRIEAEGLDYPPIGNEGNHRVAALGLLNRPIPYIEIEILP